MKKVNLKKCMIDDKLVIFGELWRPVSFTIQLSEEQIRDVENKIVESDTDTIEDLITLIHSMEIEIDEDVSPDEELRFVLTERIEQQLENRNKPDFKLLNNRELDEWRRTNPEN